MALPETLRGLLEPGAYPHPCAGIALTETHISWVLLTGNYAYKLKKPVRFSFLDFSTLALREHFCREELRCNRAFAPDLYAAVVPVYQRTDGSVHVGGTAAADNTLIEWAVQMRQFDPAAQLDSLLEHAAVTADMLASFGRDLALRHARLPNRSSAATEVDAEVIEHVCGPVQDNFSEIATTGLQGKHTALLNRTRELSHALGRHLLPLLTKRLQKGYLRECHGDLHLSNLVLIDNEVIAFDCLEFNPKLRWIDTMSDVAFLFMDCHERGRADLAYAFLNNYLDTSGDYHGAELLGYYAAYRSVVRSKVAALRWQQDPAAAAEERFLQHLQWALRWLERPPGMLVLMCGLSGAGKSYVATRLATLLPAIRLRSDVARRVVAGLEVAARTESPVSRGLYAPARSEQTFALLANTAAALLSGGENVIVDATFIERPRRAEFLALAERLGVAARIIYCTAPEATLRERIDRRSATNNDPSEATQQVLTAQLSSFTVPAPPEPVIELATAGTLSAADFEALATAIRQGRDPKSGNS